MNKDRSLDYRGKNKVVRRSFDRAKLAQNKSKSREPSESKSHATRVGPKQTLVVSAEQTSSTFNVNAEVDKQSPLDEVRDYGAISKYDGRSSPLAGLPPVGGSTK